MSKQHIPLYALTPITETDGLEDGKYRVLYRNENKISVKRFNKTFGWRLPGDATHYLRPLPGKVAVGEEELEELRECKGREFGRKFNKRL